MEIFVTSKLGMVLEFFLKNPTKEIHLRELSRAMSISLPWIRKIVLYFTKKKILSQRKKGNLVLVRANRENELFTAIKRSYNLLSLYKSRLVAELVEAYGRPEAVILFGSYSKGEDTEISDIDIAIITKRDIALRLEEFEKKLERKIKISRLERNKTEEEFLNTLANGIVLYGYLEIK